MLCVAESKEKQAMELRSVVFDILLEDDEHAFTVDEVVPGVAKKLECEIRDTLNNHHDTRRPS